jgi:integrase
LGDFQPALGCQFRQSLLGAYRVGDIKPLGVIRLAEALDAQTKQDDSKQHTAKSIHNLIGSLSSIYGLAVLEGAVEVNPVSQLPKGSLPAKSKHKRPPYTAAEAYVLMTSTKLPADRRVLCALQRYTGMRIGEAVVVDGATGI